MLSDQLFSSCPSPVVCLVWLNDEQANWSSNGKNLPVDTNSILVTWTKKQFSIYFIHRYTRISTCEATSASSTKTLVSHQDLRTTWHVNCPAESAWNRNGTSTQSQSAERSKWHEHEWKYEALFCACQGQSTSSSNINWPPALLCCGSTNICS